MEINKKRCVIYIPPEKHRDIAIRSAEEGVSINQFILSKIYKKRRWTGNLEEIIPEKILPPGRPLLNPVLCLLNIKIHAARELAP